MCLGYCDGLYYCPTDAFTVDRDPVRCNALVIRRALGPPDPVMRRYKDYIPGSHNRLTESELWMRSGLTPRAKTSLICFMARSQGYLLVFNTIHFGLLTGRRKRGCRGRPRKGPWNALRSLAAGFIWTSVLCRHCPWITPNPIRHLTG